MPARRFEHRCHLDHGPTHRRGAVDSLLVGIEGSTSSIQFRQCVCDVKDAAPQPVDRPDHQDVEASPYRVLEHCIERWALNSRPLAPLIPGILIRSQ